MMAGATTTSDRNIVNIKYFFNKDPSGSEAVHEPSDNHQMSTTRSSLNKLASDHHRVLTDNVSHRLADQLAVKMNLESEEAASDDMSDYKVEVHDKIQFQKQWLNSGLHSVSAVNGSFQSDSLNRPSTSYQKSRASKAPAPKPPVQQPTIPTALPSASQSANKQLSAKPSTPEPSRTQIITTKVQSAPKPDVAQMSPRPTHYPIANTKSDTIIMYDVVKIRSEGNYFQKNPTAKTSQTKISSNEIEFTYEPINNLEKHDQKAYNLSYSNFGFHKHKNSNSIKKWPAPSSPILSNSIPQQSNYNKNVEEDFSLYMQDDDVDYTPIKSISTHGGHQTTSKKIQRLQHKQMKSTTSSFETDFLPDTYDILGINKANHTSNQKEQLKIGSVKSSTGTIRMKLGSVFKKDSKKKSSKSQPFATNNSFDGNKNEMKMKHQSVRNLQNTTFADTKIFNSSEYNYKNHFDDQLNINSALGRNLDDEKKTTHWNTPAANNSSKRVTPSFQYQDHNPTLSPRFDPSTSRYSKVTWWNVNTIGAVPSSINSDILLRSSQAYDLVDLSVKPPPSSPQIAQIFHQGVLHTSHTSNSNSDQITKPASSTESMKQPTKNDVLNRSTNQDEIFSTSISTKL